MRKYLIILLFGLYSCGESINKDQVFSLMPSDHTGITFENTLRETETFNSLKYGYYYNGGGVAVGDVNNDSLPDIYFTANMKASHLYLNQGNWQFKEIADEAGVRAAGLWNTGTAMADVNGDGYLDIYVCRSAANIPDRRKNKLYINNGDLTFTEQSEKYGLDDPGYSTQASFFDYDRDGDLDMYLLNHSIQKFAGFDENTYRFKNRNNPYYGDKLYRNDGDKFTDVTKEAGIITNVLGFGLGVTVTDVNNDGWYDIYIANDYNEEDYLYINQHDGTFKESLRAYFRHISQNSMGSDGADFNNDLKPDIYTLDMLPEENFQLKTFIGPENYGKYQQLTGSGFYYQTMRNMLQINNGNGSFSEIGQLAGVSNTHWSWAALFADFDLDGWKDLFVSNGFRRNYLDMDFMNYAATQSSKYQPGQGEGNILEIIQEMPTIDIENYAYKNNGGITFSKVSEKWGITEKTLSNGAAYGDFDNDGDIDMVVNNINETAHIYQNNSNTLTNHNYLKLNFEGKQGNNFGVGAKVYIYSENLQQYQELMPVRGYQSSVENTMIFGLGNKTKIDSLRVVWADGSQQKLENLSANQTLTLDQNNAGQKSLNKSSSSGPLMEEVSDKSGLNFVHKENDFLDFKQNPMLPAGISNTGAPMAKGDINNDGLQDLFLGGAKGQSGILYQQRVDGSFSKVNSEFLNEDSGAEDMDASFLDVDNDGDQDLYVVSGGMDFKKDDALLQDRLYINQGNGQFSKSPDALPEVLSSGSSVTAADWDKDGDVDLFVGGRLVPGSYPLTPRSFLLSNDGQGNFKDVTEEVAPSLAKPGMVTDSKFLDINGNGFKDLVIVGEWMPVTIFLNQNGNTLEKNNNPDLKNTSGWWNTLHANDFDGDGDMDLIAGNFGLNNHYNVMKDQPVSMVYKDFDNDGAVDPILMHYLNGEKVFSFSRDVLLNQIPPLESKFPDYESFAKASPDDYYSEGEAVNADTLQAKTFETLYLQNDGEGKFTVKKLPIQTQFAPVYGLTSADINQDGNLDIITGGNQTLTRVSTGRYDANYGVILAGDGKGNFRHLDPVETGLNLRGDVRDIELLETNGQDYLLISRSDDSVKVFRKKKMMGVKPLP